jgi:hypothetical protein
MTSPGRFLSEGEIMEALIITPSIPRKCVLPKMNAVNRARADLRAPPPPLTFGKWGVCAPEGEESFGGLVVDGEATFTNSIAFEMH